MKNKRLNWVDTLRGIAIFGMVVYHLIYDLNFLGITYLNLDTLFWVVMARFVQLTFLSLVGFSLYLSYLKRAPYKNYLKHQLKRSLVVLGFALLISLASYWHIGPLYIRFGVLHFIAVAIALVSLIIRSDTVLLIFVLFSYPIGHFASSTTESSGWLIPFGITPVNFQTVDYFPLFPWLSVVCAGVLWAKIFDRYKLMNFLQFLNFYFFKWMGRRSLLIYLIHQPILFFVLNLLT